MNPSSISPVRRLQLRGFSVALVVLMQGCWPTRIVPVETGGGGRGMGAPVVTIGVAPTDPVGSSQAYSADATIVLSAGDFVVLASATSPNGMSELHLLIQRPGQSDQVATVTD